MDSTSRDMRSRRKAGLTEENIYKILNHSDFESGTEVSDGNSSFIIQRDDRENTSESPSQSSFDKDPSVNLTPATPLLSINSEKPGRIRSRGRRGGRRGILSRSRNSHSTRNSDRQNCWIGENFEPSYRNLQQPAYIPKNTADWENIEYMQQYIDDN